MKTSSTPAFAMVTIATVTTHNPSYASNITTSALSIEPNVINFNATVTSNALLTSPQTLSPHQLLLLTLIIPHHPTHSLNGIPNQHPTMSPSKPTQLTLLTHPMLGSGTLAAPIL